MTYMPETGPVLIVGRDDRLLRANRAFYQASALDVELASGLPLSQLMHADGQWQSCQICHSRLKAREAIQDAAGASSPVEQIQIFGHPMTNAKGDEMGMAMVMCGLTAVDHPEPDPAAATALLKRIFEAAYDAVYTTDLDGRFQWANKRATDLLGIDGAALEAQSYLNAVRADDLDRVRSAFDLAANGQAQMFQATFLTGDGRGAIELLVTNSPIYAEDRRVVAVLGIMRDITEERREAGREMRSDKLRALSQLAWGVAHNFNNALTAVLGYTQLVLNKIDDPVIERHLKTVEKTALDAAKMVHRIQKFARQSKDEQWRSVDLNQTIRDALELTRPRWRDEANAAGILYDVIFRPQEGAMTLCDQSAMREGFVNIINNALDAMPGGGGLAITTIVEKARLVATFADTGSGMTLETRERLFEPFYTTRGAAKGQGLGLAVTYGVIERHGGEITVTSEPGAGAIFTIILKRAPDPIPPRPRSRPAETHWTPPGSADA